MGSRVVVAVALAVLTLTGCGRERPRSATERAVDPADGVLTTAEFPRSRKRLAKYYGGRVDVVGTPAQGGLSLDPSGDAFFYLVVGAQRAVMMVEGRISEVDPAGVGDRIRVRGTLGYLDTAGIPSIQAESVEFVP